MAEVSWHAKHDLLPAVQAHLKPVPIVLDIGCGVRPQRIIPCALHLCVEPYAPYLEALRSQNPDHPSHLMLNGTWEMVLPLLLTHAVDTVVAGDVIEHLEKRDGWRLIIEAQRVAKTQCLFFTPLGFHAQNYEGRPDAWGMDGGHWQTHRSGWTPDDFGAGWQVFACEAYHDTDDHGQPCDPFGAFYALRTF